MSKTTKILLSFLVIIIGAALFSSTIILGIFSSIGGNYIIETGNGNMFMPQTHIISPQQDIDILKTFGNTFIILMVELPLLFQISFAAAFTIFGLIYILQEEIKYCLVKYYDFLKGVWTILKQSKKQLNKRREL